MIFPLHRLYPYIHTFDIYRFFYFDHVWTIKEDKIYRADHIEHDSVKPVLFHAHVYVVFHVHVCQEHTNDLLKDNRRHHEYHILPNLPFHRIHVIYPNDKWLK